VVVEWWATTGLLAPAKLRGTKGGCGGVVNGTQVGKLERDRMEPKNPNRERYMLVSKKKGVKAVS